MGDEEYDMMGKNRVYVNNMNTTQATFTLPENMSQRSKIQREHFEWEDRVSTHNDSANNFRAFQESGTQRDRSAVAAFGNMNGTSAFEQNMGGIETNAGALNTGMKSSFSVPRNPHLEELFQRLTRRLQREINYNEAARAPLTTQYGVSMNVEHYTRELEEQKELKKETDGEVRKDEQTEINSQLIRHSTVEILDQEYQWQVKSYTSPVEQTETNLSTPTTTCFTERTSDKQNIDLQKLYQHTTPQPSLLVQYRPTAEPSRMTDFISGVTANATSNMMIDASEDERVLMDQPCPAPLRLVLQHVEETILNKLGLAERGSMCDAVRFIFESRALLDRLLKEMPQYMQFHESMLFKMPELTSHVISKSNLHHFESHEQIAEQSMINQKSMYISSAPRSQSIIRSVNSSFAYSPGTSDAREAAASTNRNKQINAKAQLHKLYQEFRKQPVLIPRGVYVEDPTTGNVMAALDMTTERAFVSMTRNNAAGTNNNSRSVSNSSLVLPPIAKSPLGVANDKFVQGEAGNMSSNNNNEADVDYRNDNYNSEIDGEEVQLPPHYGQSRRLLQRLREGSESASNPWCQKDELNSHPYRKSRTSSFNSNAHGGGMNSSREPSYSRSANNSRRTEKAGNDHQGGTSTSRRRKEHFGLEENDNDDNSENANNVYEEYNNNNNEDSSSENDDDYDNDNKVYFSSDTDVYEELHNEQLSEQMSRNDLYHHAYGANSRINRKRSSSIMDNRNKKSTSAPHSSQTKAVYRHARQQSAAGNAKFSSTQKCSLSMARRRATQHFHASTLTEENNGNMVTREEYESVLDKIHELEIELHEANLAQSNLITQLQNESGYAERHARVVEYLRSTLVKECNMLRSQLSYVAQRQENQIPTLPLPPSSSSNQLPHTYGRMQSMREGTLTGAGNATVDSHNLSQTQHTNINNNNNNASSPPPPPFPSSSTCNSEKAVMAVNYHNRSNSVSQTNLAQSQRLVSNTLSGTNTMGSVNNANNEMSMSVLNESQRLSPARMSVASNVNGRAKLKSDDRKQQPPVSTLPASMNASDVTSLQSLLDLVLLTVEKEQVLSCSMSVLHPETNESTHRTYKLEENARIHAHAIKAEFESKQQILKNSVVAMRVKDAFTIANKDKEIARLQSLTDMKYVQGVLLSYVQELRREFVKMRVAIEEQMHLLRVNMTNTISSVLNRTRVMDSTMDDNVSLRTSQEALRMLIDGAHALMLPMLTHEYTHGYHPWPIKSRNTVDPLAHVIQTRFGVQEVMKLREPLSELSELYVSIHRVMSNVLIIPDMHKPMTGKALEVLCSKLALNPLCPSDLLFAIRQHYATECALRHKLAQCHAKVMWNAYMQSVLTSRAVTALIEGGMNPNTTSLPVANKINSLARERAALSRERLLMQKERMANAKEVYYLWRDRQIDLYHGEPAVPVISNKLTLNLEMPVGNTAAFATRRGRNQSNKFNRISLLDIKPPNWQLSSPSLSISSPVESLEQTPAMTGNASTNKHQDNNIKNDRFAELLEQDTNNGIEVAESKS